MYSEKDYKRHIQTLSWDILISAYSKEMPIRITPIAKIYYIQHLMNYKETRWRNVKLICTEILNSFGLNYCESANKQLAVRLLAPACVLKECSVSYPEEIVRLCDIPYTEAVLRLKRLDELKKINKFYVSDMEIKVKNQFCEFIAGYNHSKQCDL